MKAHQLVTKIIFFLNILGEVIDDRLIDKGRSKKLFDDTLDSGISESSNFEAHREIKIKQERESSVESSRHMEPKPRRSRKRKISEESVVAPVQKRIKSEPTSDEHELTPQTSSKRIKDKNKSTDFTSCGSFDTTLIGSTPKEKKHKKKNKRDKEEDFEASLQLLISAASIKSEVK